MPHRIRARKLRAWESRIESDSNGSSHDVSDRRMANTAFSDAEQAALVRSITVVARHHYFMLTGARHMSYTLRHGNRMVSARDGTRASPTHSVAFQPGARPAEYAC